MTCGDCNDAASCVTCNAGYEMANGATVCTKIPEPQPTTEKGSTWLWWLLGSLVIILIVVGVACMIMKNKKDGSNYDGKGNSDDGFDNSRDGDENIEM